MSHCISLSCYWHNAVIVWLTESRLVMMWSTWLCTVWSVVVSVGAIFIIAIVHLRSSRPQVPSPQVPLLLSQSGLTSTALKAFIAGFNSCLVKYDSPAPGRFYWAAFFLIVPFYSWHLSFFLFFLLEVQTSSSPVFIVLLMSPVSKSTHCDHICYNSHLRPRRLLPSTAHTHQLSVRSMAERWHSELTETQPDTFPFFFFC